MYDLQDYLGRGAITEEEYNKIEKRLENAFENEDYSSGRKFQSGERKDLSLKAQ